MLSFKYLLSMIASKIGRKIYSLLETRSNLVIIIIIFLGSTRVFLGYFSVDFREIFRTDVFWWGNFACKISSFISLPVSSYRPFSDFLGVERSSISLCRRSEQAQWFLRELIYSSDIHPQKYNPLNILNLSRFQNIVEYSNINIDNAH